MRRCASAVGAMVLSGMINWQMATNESDWGWLLLIIRDGGQDGNLKEGGKEGGNMSVWEGGCGDVGTVSR